jgi:hypothetical protein
MKEIRVMIANGGDTNEYRDRAIDVVKRLNHLFLHELGRDISITFWDYRLDSPTVIPAGSMSTRSLSKVDQSEFLLAIFGPTVPIITSQELIEGFERRLAGINIEICTFVNPDTITQAHTDYFQGIADNYDEEIVWGEYRDELEFQGTLMTTLFKYLIGRVGAQFPGMAA